MLNKINISFQKQKLIVYIFLTLVTLAVFWQVNQYDFYDPVYVTENSHVQSGITLDGFLWAFSTTYAEFWHPLTWLSLMLDHQLYGLNAGGYHLTSLLLHIMGTLMLFWLFNRMTGAIWCSAFVAAFFALHPLRLESVVPISERKDVLSAFFWMLTLCFYIYYAEKPNVKRYLLVLGIFVLALMSKPMVVTLPVIMVLLDYWPLGRFNSKKGNLILWQLLEKTPFFVLSAIFSIIAIYAHYDPSIEYLSPGLRLANAHISFLSYLEKIFWPHDFGMYPIFERLSLWQVWGSVILMIIISAAAIVWVKRLPYLFVGWSWYIITLLPVIGIVKGGRMHIMTDHYTYLPSIGIAIILAWGIPLLFPHESTRRKILFPASIVVLAILAVLTWQQCRYFKNITTICGQFLRVTKDNYLTNNSVDLTLSAEGIIEEAIDHYNKAIRLKPDDAHAYNNRGTNYFRLGQHQRAIEDFNQAIRLKPDYAYAYTNRGIAYGVQHGFNVQFGSDVLKACSLGDCKMLEFAEVHRYYIRPVDAYAFNNRAIYYAKNGEYQLAIDDFNQAIFLNPNYVYPYINRGITYLMQGNNELCCRDAQKACTLGNCKLLEIVKGKGTCR